MNRLELNLDQDRFYEEPEETLAKVSKELEKLYNEQVR